MLERTIHDDVFSIGNDGTADFGNAWFEVEDMDFQRKLIHVRRSVDSRTRKEQPTKSKASTAAVPMPAELEKRLQNFLKLEWRESLRVSVRQPKWNTHSRGKIIEYGLWPAQDACGILRSGLHAFRHQIASELLEGGAAPSVVQKQMRHSDARVTLDATRM